MLELDTSARKLPRKLGYGAASQPTTPRSVSFHEPPLSSLPRHLAGEMSQPASPKSVSFADESRTPGTPKQMRFAELRTSASKPAKKSPEIQRSIKDRSPTPERLVSPTTLPFFFLAKSSTFYENSLPCRQFIADNSNEMSVDSWRESLWKHETHQTKIADLVLLHPLQIVYA